ncbi:MAG TPA: helix-hairpin-helix domain-containing protein [Thiotrichales bacterium]|nr:helix-hairpin-helix domain-containing protein [Thiotrichales bacterium]
MRSILLSLSLLAGLWSGMALGGGGVDINTASAEELAEALQGVGPSKAEAIVAYRKQNGPFRSVDELVEVKGIGEATIEANRDRLTASEMLPSSD